MLFPQTMDAILIGVERQYALAHLDDMAIFLKTPERHTNMSV